MIRNISFTLNEARTKLTRLGMVLFYVYILLALTGCAGFIFGLISMILKCMQLGAAVNTGWLELIILTLVAGFMVKFFLRESGCLLRTDKVQEPLDKDYEIEEPPQIYNSTVVPFKRKSNW
jgi:hypothetical protein